jgi:release factor glutamine methyltransferase
MGKAFSTIGDALKWASVRLNEAGVEDAESEAEFLLTGLLRVKRHELFLDPSRPLTLNETELFQASITRRARREPAQYITGIAGFMGLDFKVTRDTLIPRPETELLVEEALNRAKGLTTEKIIIDLCTGCGCIAVAMAKSLSGCRVYATDISAAALDVARENAEAHGVMDRIEFLKGDLYSPLEPLGLRANTQLILSNPPYVSEEEMAALPTEIKEYEPRGALYGGEDGLVLIRRIIETSPEYLAPDGALIMEAGYGQGAKVLELIRGSGAFREAEMKKDLAGIERVLVAVRDNPGKRLPGN